MRLSIESIVDGFDHTSLHDRFLCGGSALREARRVSRIRLALIDNGFVEDDLPAQLLANDIKNYRQAKYRLLGLRQLSVKSLKDIHALLLPNQPFSGKLRANEGFIGTSKDKATYILPKASEVAPSIEAYVKAFNQLTTLSTEQLIEQFAKFLLIHPFKDGNGRMARLLVHSMMHRSATKYHIELYRLGTPIFVYQDAILAFRSSDGEGVENNYWKAMRNWTSVYDDRAQKVIVRLKKNLHSQLTMTPIDDVDLTLIQLALEKHVINAAMATTQSTFSPTSVNESLAKLVSSGVFKHYKLKSGNDVFVSPVMMDCFNAFDELLFEDKVLESTESYTPHNQQIRK